MARRAAKIDMLRGVDAELLLISAGDFSADPGIVEMYRTRFLASTMITLGYDAVAVGERELNHGIRTLRAEAEEGLPLLCANLYENGERIFPACLVKRVHGKRIGILALLGVEPRETHGIEIRDPAREGREAIESLRGRTDCIVLLAHMGREELADLLPALEGVDFVVRAHSAGIEQGTENCADTTGGFFEDASRPVLFAGDRGRQIGLAVVAADPGGRAALLEQRLIDLDSSVPDDSLTAERLRTFLKEEGDRRRDLTLSKGLMRDETSGRILDRYLGVDVCVRCHGDLLPRFTLSRHSRAMETLRARGEERNPLCLKCHTTGYGYPTGYDPETEMKGAPFLQGVQCEACHGPGTKHERTGAYAAAAWKSCRACHTSRWSPDFDERESWKRAAHCGAFADSASAGGTP